MKIELKKGFRFLLIKFAVFYFLAFIILSYLNSIGGKAVYSIFPFLIPLELGLFLFLLAKEKLLEIPEFKIKVFDFLFIIPSILFFFIRINSVWEFRDVFSVIAFFFLAIAIFGKETTKFVLNECRKEIIIALLFFSAYRIFFIATLQYWNVLALFSASIVQWMLSLSFPQSQLTFDGLIRLGYAKFDVIVAQECAGIESLVLFFVMFLVAASLEFKKLNKFRFVFALIFGLILLFILSILRLYLIMLTGLLIDPFFAVRIVHPYSSLIIFVGFFLIYWNYSFKWVKNK
ncbi:MAG: archaeosortase/exosortase family protein [archaeon]|nr:archaeosortase/exosortase family protein [archaeon]